MVDRILVMPKLGLTMTEGTLVEWKILPGESFHAGDTLCVVETEKITNDVEASSDGVMSEHLVETGATVAAGAAVARWRGTDAENHGTAPNLDAPASPRPTTVAALAPGVETAAIPRVNRDADRPIATPLARKIARERGIDLRQIQGSGPRGRIKSADLSADGRAPPASIDWAEAPTSFFVATEINARPLTDLMKKVSQLHQLEKIELAHLAALAAARVLQENSKFNRRWTPGGVTQLVEAAIAVTLRGGECVIHDAGGKSLSAFVAESADPHVTAAVSVAATTAEHVTAMSLPLSPGRSLSVALGAVHVAFRPDAGGQPVMTEEIAVVVSCDSRLFDNASGAEFLLGLRKYLESPILILAG